MLVQNIEDDQIYAASRYEGWGSLLIWMQSWGDRMSRYHRNGVRGVGMWGDWQGSSVLPPVDMRCLSLSLSLCVSRCVSVHLCVYLCMRQRVASFLYGRQVWPDCQPGYLVVDKGRDCTKDPVS